MIYLLLQLLFIRGSSAKKQNFYITVEIVNLTKYNNIINGKPALITCMYIKCVFQVIYILGLQ